VTGIDLSGCRSRGAQVILCPQHMGTEARPQCGFRTVGAEPINCTMEAMAASHVPPQVAYIGSGTYCVTTEAQRYRHGPQQWCPIPHSSFCFKPKAEVHVAQQRILPIPEPSSVHLSVRENITDLHTYVARFGYDIPPVKEDLKKLLATVELSQKHIFSLEQKTQDIGREIEDIRSPDWWNLGSWIVIPAWIRIASHLLIVCQLIIVFYLLCVNCKFRKKRKTAELRKLLNRSSLHSQNRTSPV